MMNSVFKMMTFVSKNDDSNTKRPGDKDKASDKGVFLHINDDFPIKNDDFVLRKCRFVTKTSRISSSSVRVCTKLAFLY